MTETCLEFLRGGSNLRDQVLLPEPAVFLMALNRKDRHQNARDLLQDLLDLRQWQLVPLDGGKQESVLIPSKESGEYYIGILGNQREVVFKKVQEEFSVKTRTQAISVDACNYPPEQWVDIEPVTDILAVAIYR